MENKIKQSYEKITISDGAKDRIEMAIVMEDRKNARPKKVYYKSRFKVAVAACLTLAVVLPTGTFAAEKLYQYYKASVKEHGYLVDVELDKDKSTTQTAKNQTAQQYVKLVTDFGSDYTLDKEAGTSDGIASYNYKGGFSSGKCFWYELKYLDGDDKQVLSNYDTDKNETITINGRKAIYSRTNTIVGSKYTDDYETSYGQVLYVFAEDYGYVLELAAQNALPKDDLINLAKSIKIEKAASKADASRYVLLSESKTSAWNIKAENAKPIKVNPEHYYTKQADYKNATFTVKDVKVLDNVKGLKKDAFLTGQFPFSSLVSSDGTLKKYDRELLKLGDGITEPEKKVIKTESVQSKLVYVTLEVKNSNALAVDSNYYVPSLQFITKKKDNLYVESYREKYNRPKMVDEALVDLMPCYLEENLGGKSSWAVRSSSGTLTLHLAYLVDEDFTDEMALWINGDAESGSEGYYLSVTK